LPTAFPSPARRGAPSRMPLAAVLAVCVLALAFPRGASAHRAPAEALARADSALAADAGNARLHLERAGLLRWRGNPAAAEADYRRALALDPSLRAARAGLAGVLLENGRPLEALAAIGTGTDPAERVLRARSLAAAGRPRDAAREFDAALSAMPDPTPDLFLARSDVATTPADAIRLLDEGIARLGGSAALELRAAELEIARGDAAAAQRRIDRLERRADTVGRDTPGTADSPAAVAGPSSAAAVGTPVLVRGPYLQNATPHSVVVRWRTETPTTSRVEVHRTGLAQPGDRDAAISFGRNAVTAEHEVTLFGLQPETRYEYTIGAVGSMIGRGNSTYSFVTPPLAGPARPIRFWVLGDSGTGNGNAAAVRDAYLAYPGADETDFWLMLGDNAYDSGTDLEYQSAVFDMYPTFLASFPLWLAHGNHDAPHGGELNDYYELFTLPTAGQAGGVPSGTEAYYSFDWANVHFVCLDSMDSDRAVNGAMHLWLEQDLAATTADWVIAFWHHPPYTKGSHDSDDTGDSGRRMIDMRENFLPLLESAGVDLVLGGHSHDYERSFLIDGHYGSSSTFGPQFLVDGGDGDPGGDGPYAKPTLGPAPHEGTVYAVAGNSGKVDTTAPLDHPAMFVSRAVLGSMVIDVDGDRLDAVELDSAGAVRDRFAIVKGGGFVGSPLAEAGRGGPELTAAGTPFREAIRFDFSVPRRGPATLQVFDLHGRRVARLRDGILAPGTHSVAWDGRDVQGHVVASGVYFAVLSFEGERRVRHVVKAR
jgi:tetratricopeptide (TPR) repeat protein